MVSLQMKKLNENEQVGRPQTQSHGIILNKNLNSNSQKIQSILKDRRGEFMDLV